MFRPVRPCAVPVNGQLLAVSEADRLPVSPFNTVRHRARLYPADTGRAAVGRLTVSSILRGVAQPADSPAARTALWRPTAVPSRPRAQAQILDSTQIETRCGSVLRRAVGRERPARRRAERLPPTRPPGASTPRSALRPRRRAPSSRCCQHWSSPGQQCPDRWRFSPTGRDQVVLGGAAGLAITYLVGNLFGVGV